MEDENIDRYLEMLEKLAHEGKRHVAVIPPELAGPNVMKHFWIAQEFLNGKPSSAPRSGERLFSGLVNLTLEAFKAHINLKPVNRKIRLEGENENGEVEFDMTAIPRGNRSERTHPSFHALEISVEQTKKRVDEHIQITCGETYFEHNITSHGRMSFYWP